MYLAHDTGIDKLSSCWLVEKATEEMLLYALPIPVRIDTAVPGGVFMADEVFSEITDLIVTMLHCWLGWAEGDSMVSWLLLECVPGF